MYIMHMQCLYLYTGEIRTLLYFNSTLSDNLISELALVPTNLRNQPECRCPPFYPTTHEEICEHVSGSPALSRLSEYSRVPSFIIDGNRETWWESAMSDAPVNVTISLGGLRAPLGVLVKFRTVLPQSMLLYSSTNGVDFDSLGLYASNCSRFNLLDNGLVDNSTIDSCSSLPLNLLQSIEFVHFDTMPFSGPTPEGRYILPVYIAQATHIRLELIEWSSDIALSEVSFSINEVTVYGQECACNGHSDTCDGAVCRECSHNTTGANCNQCLPLFNDQPWAPATPSSSNECKLCSCNNHSISCSYDSTIDSGVCDNCQDNTQGSQCELCIETHFQSPSKTLSDPNICQLCHEECVGCNGPSSTNCMVSGMH